MKRIMKQTFFAVVLMTALTGMKVKAGSSLLKTEKEPELELESWMIDESFWSKATVDVVEAADPELGIEAWMTDDNYWR